MSARAFTALLLAGSVLSAAPAWSQVDAFTVRFLDGEDQIIRLQAARVIAYDADGTPLFEAGLNYIRAYTENWKGRVYEWNPHTKRVRVSPDGVDEVWLDCKDLKRMTVACGPRLQIEGAVIYVGEGEVPPAMLPDYPPPPPPPPPPPGSEDEIAYDAAEPDVEASEAPYGTLPNGSGTGQGYGLGSGPGTGRGIPICPGDPRCKKVRGPGG